MRSKWTDGWSYYRMLDNAEMGTKQMQSKWKYTTSTNLFNNHSAVPLTQYNTEFIWVNELRLSKLTVADSSLRAVYSTVLLGMRVLCVVRYRSLQRADQSFRGVLPSFVCLSVIEKPHGGGLGPLWLSKHEKRKTDRRDCHVRGAYKTVNNASYAISDKAKCRITAGRVIRILLCYLI